MKNEKLNNHVFETVCLHQPVRGVVVARHLREKFKLAAHDKGDELSDAEVYASLQRMTANGLLREDVQDIADPKRRRRNGPNTEVVYSINKNGGKRQDAGEQSAISGLDAGNLGLA